MDGQRGSFVRALGGLLFHMHRIPDPSSGLGFPEEQFQYSVSSRCCTRCVSTFSLLLKSNPAQLYAILYIDKGLPAVKHLKAAWSCVSETMLRLLKSFTEVSFLRFGGCNIGLIFSFLQTIIFIR